MSLRVAIVGAGYWGPKVARVLAAAGATIRAVCDVDHGRAVALSRLYPTAAAFTPDYPRDVDAVVFATPPTPERAQQAARALEAGKHVWIEKPLATSSLDAMLLTAGARTAGRVLFVDHTFCYHPAVRKAREIVQSGALGTLRYFDSTRVNLGLVQRDVSVWWDLAPHDLSIFEYVTGCRVEAVRALAACHAPANQASMAFIDLIAGPVVGHLTLGWTSPVKLRRSVFGGSERTVVYDDLDRDGPVRVYDRAAVGQEDGRVGYRDGDVWLPKVAGGEALAVAAAEFVDCCVSGRLPLTGGAEGARVAAVLEAVDRSVAANGVVVRV